MQLELPPRVRPGTGVPTFDPAWPAAIADALARVAALVDLRIFTEPQQGASYDELLAVAQRAEALGFDAFFRSDHYLKMGDVSGPPGTDRRVGDPRRHRPGDHADPPRHAGHRGDVPPPGPARHLASPRSTQMCGGRVELGIGTGWYDDEHHAYGIPFPPLGERFERLEEQLAIITGLWETPEGETFSYDGRHYAVVDSPGAAEAGAAAAAADHHRRLGLEAHAAAGGPLRRRVQRAVPAGRRRSPARLRARRRACEAIGRDPATIVRSVAVTDLRRRRRGGVRAAGRGHRPRARRAAGDGIAGTPDEAAEQLAAFAEAGAERVYLQVLDLRDLDHLDASPSAPASRAARRVTRPAAGSRVALVEQPVVHAVLALRPELDASTASSRYMPQCAGRGIGRPSAKRAASSAKRRSSAARSGIGSALL